MAGVLLFIWKMVGPILINLAITVGMPAAIQWIVKKLPFLSAEAVEKIIKAILDAVGGIQAVKADPELGSRERKIQIKAIKRQAVRDCSGTACVSDTKGF